jgi:hypothetical protein
MERPEQIHAAIATLIRDRSENKQLVQFNEISEELNRQGFLKSEMSDHETHLEPIMGDVLKENEDLREISGAGGMLYYYSARSLSETYAGLLVGKEEDPLLLIAQTVRENSAIYPRPIPLNIFGQPPFDFTERDMLLVLEKMDQQEQYRDIVRTITSIGTTFLFSNRHLDPDHAYTLAEWLDVGQSNNP